MPARTRTAPNASTRDRRPACALSRSCAAREASVHRPGLFAARLGAAGRLEVRDQRSAHRQGVTRDSDHPEPLFEPPLDQRRGRVDPRHDAGVATTLDDGGKRVVELAVAVVVAGLEAEGDRQVGRPDVDRVDARYGQDVVQVADRLDRLDHRDQGDAVTCPIEVVRSTHPGDDRSEAARSDGRITAGTDDRLSLGHAVEHRHDDSLDTGIEHLADDARLVPRHAADRGAAAQHHRLGHGDGGLVVVYAVLVVDAHVVESNPSRRLRADDRRDRQPHTEGVAALTPLRSQSVHGPVLANVHTVTMVAGRPGSTFRALSIACEYSLRRPATVADATCGVTITRGCPSSGCPSGSGSGSVTSRPAPATWPDSSAASSASWSTRPPRAQLTMYTPCFIVDSDCALIMCCVASTAGACKEITSDPANTSSRLTSWQLSASLTKGS